MVLDAIASDFSKNESFFEIFSDCISSGQEIPSRIPQKLKSRLCALKSCYDHPELYQVPIEKKEAFRKIFLEKVQKIQSQSTFQEQQQPFEEHACAAELFFNPVFEPCFRSYSLEEQQEVLEFLKGLSPDTGFSDVQWIEKAGAISPQALLESIRFVQGRANQCAQILAGDLEDEEILRALEDCLERTPIEKRLPFLFLGFSLLEGSVEEDRANLIAYFMDPYIEWFFALFKEKREMLFAFFKGLSPEKREVFLSCMSTDFRNLQASVDLIGSLFFETEEEREIFVDVLKKIESLSSMVVERVVHLRDLLFFKGHLKNREEAFEVVEFIRSHKYLGRYPLPFDFAQASLEQKKIFFQKMQEICKDFSTELTKFFLNIFEKRFFPERSLDEVVKWMPLMVRSTYLLVFLSLAEGQSFEEFHKMYEWMKTAGLKDCSEISSEEIEAYANFLGVGWEDSWAVFKQVKEEIPYFLSEENTFHLLLFFILRSRKSSAEQSLKCWKMLKDLIFQEPTQEECNSVVNVCCLWIRSFEDLELIYSFFVDFLPSSTSWERAILMRDFFYLTRDYDFSQKRELLEAFKVCSLNSWSESQKNALMQCYFSLLRMFPDDMEPLMAIFETSRRYGTCPSTTLALVIFFCSFVNQHGFHSEFFTNGCLDCVYDGIPQGLSQEEKGPLFMAIVKGINPPSSIEETDAYLDRLNFLIPDNFNEEQRSVCFCALAQEAPLVSSESRSDFWDVIDQCRENFADIDPENWFFTLEQMRKCLFKREEQLPLTSLFQEERTADYKPYYPIELLRSGMDESVVQALFNSFQEIPNREYAKAFSSALSPWMSRVSHEAEASSLIVLFQKIPQKQWSNFNELVFSLLGKEASIERLPDLKKFSIDLGFEGSTREEFFSFLERVLQKKDAPQGLLSYIFQEQVRWSLERDDPLVEKARWSLFRTQFDQLFADLPENDLICGAIEELLENRSFQNFPFGVESRVKPLWNHWMRFQTSNISPEYKKRGEELVQSKLKGCVKVWRNLSEIEKLSTLENFLEIGKVQESPEWSNAPLVLKMHVLQTLEVCCQKETLQKLLQKFSLSELEDIFSITQESFGEIDSLAFFESWFKRMLDCQDIAEIAALAKEPRKKIFLHLSILELVERIEEETSIDLSPLSVAFESLWTSLIQPDMDFDFVDAITASMENAQIIETLQKIYDEEGIQGIERSFSLLSDAIRPFCRKKMDVQEIPFLVSIFVPYRQDPWSFADAARLSPFIARCLGNKTSHFEIQQLFSFLLTYFPLGEVSMERLKEQLQEWAVGATVDAQSRYKALHLARELLLYQRLLNLQDEDPLMREAFKALLLLERRREDPSFVLAEIKHKRLEEPAGMIFAGIENIPIVSSGVPYPVLGKVSLPSLQALLKKLEARKKTYRDLAEWIEKRNESYLAQNPKALLLGPSVFKDLLCQVKAHLLQKKSGVQKGSLEEKILEKRLFELEEMRMDFTDESRLAHQLMEKAFGGAQEIVPSELIRLYAIADAILTQSGEKEGLFTPQEEMAFIWLPLISECSIGQEAGISLCYYSMQALGYIEGNSLLGAQETEGAEMFLDELIQKALHETIVSPEFLELFSFQPHELEQEAHQIYYLKNIIGKECGLDHQEEIDPCSFHISRLLRSLERRPIVEHFLKELCRRLHSSVSSSFNHLPARAKSKQFNLLERLFSHHGIDSEKAWEIVSIPPQKSSFGGKEERVTLELVSKLLSQCEPFPKLWTLDESFALTEEGQRQFQKFLKEHGWEVVDAGKVTDANASLILLFAEHCLLKAFQAPWYDGKCLTKEGEKVFGRQLQDPHTALFKAMKSSYLQDRKRNWERWVQKEREGLSEEEKEIFDHEIENESSELSLRCKGSFSIKVSKTFEEYVLEKKENLSKEPFLLASFFKDLPSLYIPWKLQPVLSGWSLTDFGALAVLSKCGYLTLQKEFEDLVSFSGELYKVSLELSQRAPVGPLLVQQARKQLERERRIPQNATRVQESEQELKKLTQYDVLLEKKHSLEKALEAVEQKLLHAPQETVRPADRSFRDTLLPEEREDLPADLRALRDAAEDPSNQAVFEKVNDLYLKACDEYEKYLELENPQDLSTGF